MSTKPTQPLSQDTAVSVTESHRMGLCIVPIVLIVRRHADKQITPMREFYATKILKTFDIHKKIVRETRQPHQNAEW